MERKTRHALGFVEGEAIQASRPPTWIVFTGLPPTIARSGRALFRKTGAVEDRDAAPVRNHRPAPTPCKHVAVQRIQRRIVDVRRTLSITWSGVRPLSGTTGMTDEKCPQLMVVHPAAFKDGENSMAVAPVC
jgi:hypothetical protein